MSAAPGCLFVVATPIGHLDDLSARAIDTLQSCDWIACEDTRVTQKLLQRIHCQTRTLSYREANERPLARKLVARLLAGEQGALVCDAGTPTMSDPGFHLVRECRRQQVSVTPIPGPMAAISALSVSGLPTHGFLFVGFLPAKKSARLRFFTQYHDFPYSLVLYESCHRITKFVTDLLATLGPERTLCLAREVTKRHETFYVGAAAEVASALQQSTSKGEFVVVIAPQGFVL